MRVIVSFLNSITCSGSKGMISARQILSTPVFRRQMYDNILISESIFYGKSSSYIRKRIRGGNFIFRIGMIIKYNSGQ